MGQITLPWSHAAEGGPQARPALFPAPRSAVTGRGTGRSRPPGSQQDQLGAVPGPGSSVK